MLDVLVLPGRKTVRRPTTDRLLSLPTDPCESDASTQCPIAQPLRPQMAWSPSSWVVYALDRPVVLFNSVVQILDPTNHDCLLAPGIDVIHRCLVRTALVQIDFLRFAVGGHRFL